MSKARKQSDARRNRRVKPQREVSNKKGLHVVVSRWFNPRLGRMVFVKYYPTTQLVPLGNNKFKQVVHWNNFKTV